MDSFLRAARARPSPPETALACLALTVPRRRNTLLHAAADLLCLSAAGASDSAVLRARLPEGVPMTPIRLLAAVLAWLAATAGPPR